ncbi:hypothetical protein Psyaliredsea_12390 [Psychrobacter alimentarius]
MSNKNNHPDSPVVESTVVKASNEKSKSQQQPKVVNLDWPQGKIEWLS